MQIRSSDPIESQQPYKFEVKVLFNLMQAICTVLSFKSAITRTDSSTYSVSNAMIEMPFLADGRFGTVFSANMSDVK